MKSNLQTVSIPREMKSQHVFKDIELEGVIPEYSPDISRLVRVDASPYVESVKCSEKCEISGRIIFGLLYESDYKSKLAYTTFTVPFELKCDIASARETYPTVKCDCTYLTCRLLGQRKVSVKAKLEGVVSGVQVDDFTMASNMGDDLNTYFKTTMLSATIPVAKAETSCEIKENIRLNEVVSSVVYANATFSKPEAEAFETSASVRSYMEIHALCELENGEYKMFEQKIPVEVSVKSDSISSDSILDGEIDNVDLSAVADLDEYGENKLINVRCTVKASLTVKKASDITLPLDAFCKKQECKCERTPVVIDQTKKQSGKSISLERTHSAEGEIDSVISSDTFIEIFEARPTANTLLVKGKAKTEVLAKSGESVVSRTFTDDFEDSVPFDCDTTPEIAGVTVFESKAELYGDTLNLKAMAFVDIETTEHNQYDVLTMLELGEAVESASGGFKFYYPDSDETVWDIAKKYHIDPQRILTENAENLDQDGRLVGKRYVSIR